MTMASVLTLERTCSGADVPLRELLERTLICRVDPGDTLLEARTVFYNSKDSLETMQIPTTGLSFVPPAHGL